jgi:hypothetical protein
VKIVIEHAYGRDSIENAKSVTITSFGIYSADQHVAEITIDGMGQLAWADPATGRKFGAVTVER